MREAARTSKDDVADPRYVALCYHYLRPDKRLDRFPRIIGNSMAEFRAHVAALKDAFPMVTPGDALAVAGADECGVSQPRGVLFTFDDGLAEHATAAEILADNGIKGVFSIPTCLLTDGVPPNPTIIHFALAHAGIERFLEAYRRGLEEERLPRERYDVAFVRGESDPWVTIFAIKRMFKYDIGETAGRNILLSIYRTLLQAEIEGMLALMHVTSEQIAQMVEMGHSIAGHTHTHMSMRGEAMAGDYVRNELVRPRDILAARFGAPVRIFTYPFGEDADCLANDVFASLGTGYQIAYTIRKEAVTGRSPPYELGRISMPRTIVADMLVANVNTLLS